jgi:hypothetical protein
VPGLHPAQPEGIDRALRHLGAGPIGAEKRAGGQILVELGAIGDAGGANAVEHVDRESAGIGRRLQHERRHGRHERQFGYARRAVPADVACHFTAAHGESDEDRVLQIERLHQRREIVGERVHVVTGPRLARPAVAAPIVGDAPIAVRGQQKHLGFPAVGVQRPSMAEDNGRTAAPILVVDLGSVPGGDGGHAARY